MKTNNIDFKKIIFSLFVFIISASISLGQVVKTDSLIRVLNQNLTSIERIKTLTELCYSPGFAAISDKNKYLLQLDSLAKSEKNLELQAEAYSTLGKAFEETNLIKANENYLTALKLYKDIGGKSGEWGYAKTLLKHGTVFHYNGDFGTAITMYLEAENTLNKYNDLNQLAVLYIKLGDAYDKLGNSEKRNLYNQKAIDLAIKSNDRQLLGKAYMTKAINLIYEDKYKEAEIFCNQAQQIALQSGNKMQQHIVYYNLGLLNSRQEKYNESLIFYRKAFEIAKEMKAYNDECDALYKIGLVQYYMENFPVARKTLQDAFVIADSLKSDILKRNIYDVLSCLETEAGNHKKANEYLNNYIDLVYRIFSDESQKQVNFLDAKYQAQKREGEIVRLEDEKKIKDLQLTKTRQWIIILLSIVLLLTAITIFIQVNYRQKRKIAQQESRLKEQQIIELEKDRQLLATQSVLKGEEAERSRLAKDLHDGLGGLLLSVKLALSNSKGNMVISEEGASQYDKALNLLDNSMKELRRVAHNMMPEALVKFGLKDAISDFCNSIEGNLDQTKINFQYFGNENRIDSKYEISLYRIAQELINNAIKYSGASEILVQIVQDEKRIHLTVQDNGKGFAISKLQSSTGAGLANIRSRAESLGGKLEIFSEPGKGTEISTEFFI